MIFLIRFKLKALRQLIFAFVLFSTIYTISCSSNTGKISQNGDSLVVEFFKHESEHKINMMIDGQHFASNKWPKVVYKHVLHPILTSSGTFITRGFPLDPRPGERPDHRHHVGNWLNYGDVNRVDFWRNGHTVERSVNGVEIKLLNSEKVSQDVMQRIYDEVKTPYKYGVVFKHPDSSKMVDSPTIFRHANKWFMSYIVFDGQGYESWLAESDNLLDWHLKGRILSFTKNTWDANQKAGYMALVDTEWEGSYEVETHDGKFWLSYLGGASEGYEKGVLGVGMAFSNSLDSVKEWTRIEKPVLLPDDEDARWFEEKKIYKSSIIHDDQRHTGYPYVMYYNAKGDTADYESIGMAVSDNMIDWIRFGTNPVITKNSGICGDAQIVKINDVYVMFYFGAFWKPGAFERFACSYDLINWTDWQGTDLIAPSESYDQKYAHKPWVIKWNGIVYHFYNAVGDEGRVIALATSINLIK